MKFDYKQMAHWPSLAWLAECSANGEIIHLYHGGEVETKEHWFCEAVWAGDFPSGDFDKTDISDEMAPWDVGGGYNRPLCRRIVETAGVPRALFGVNKRGMSVAILSP